MPFSVGDRLGPYEVLASIGAGGMGEVYRAKDTKLKREVALKVLPAAFASDPERMARFQREAEVLASLNHPNIAAIYGVEEGALVMELVEGESPMGPLPFDEAWHIASQIATALEYAHDKGVIHRDLKPANVKITPEGVVKLLDFGLAKAMSNQREAPASASENSPTLTIGATEVGVVLGTAAYMAPEQAKGKSVDKRADIWAFGVVLYELLTGTRPFKGEDVPETLVSVIRDEPDLSKTPPKARKLLGRCLEKDPKKRLRDIGEAAFLLDEPAVQAPTVPARRWIPWSAAGVLAITLLAGGAWLRLETSDPGLGALRFELALPAGTTTVGIGISGAQAVPSPDGRNLAFIAHDTASGMDGLWVRPLGATTPHRLDKTEAASFPFWSPDGQFIAFFADDKLKRIAVSAGSVLTICDLSSAAAGPNGGGGDGGTWNNDGVIVFANNGKGPLMRVTGIGGLPTPVTALEKDESWHSWPQFLPDGRHLLYLAVNTDSAKSAIYVQELGSTKRVRVIQNSTRGLWSPPGYLLFVRDGTLYAQRMDPKTFQVEGEPLLVAPEVAANEGNGRSAFAVSQNGVLAYRAGSGTQLAWYDREGKRLGPVGQPGEFASQALSPDGKSVALLIGHAKYDTWVMDVATGVLTRMTRDSQEAVNATPTWSPDSQRLAVTEVSGGIREVAVASGKVTPLLSEALYEDDWSPDGRSLLCVDLPGNHLALFTPGAGAKPQTILDTPYRKVQFRFSPDGQYVAYVSAEAGHNDVYVASFPSFAVKRKVSPGGGVAPAWARSGKELLYRSTDGSLMSAGIRTSPNLVADTPKPLFKFSFAANGSRFSVSADGRRFLMSEAKGGSTGDIQPEFTLVLNWAADIK